MARPELVGFFKQSHIKNTVGAAAGLQGHSELRGEQRRCIVNSFHTERPFARNDLADGMVRHSSSQQGQASADIKKMITDGNAAVTSTLTATNDRLDTTNQLTTTSDQR